MYPGNAGPDAFAPWGTAMNKLRSLRSRMLLGAAAVLVLLTGISQYRAEERRLSEIDDAYVKLQFQVDAIARRHADILRNTHTLFMALLTDLDVKTFGTGDSCRNAMNDLLARESTLDNIGLAQLDGNTTCNGRNFQSVDLARLPFFQQALRVNDTVVGTPMIAPNTGNWVLPFARAIRDGRGNPEAVLAASISLSNLLDEFSQTEFVKTARMGIVDADGMVLAHYPDAARMVGRNISTEHFFNTIIAAGGRGTAEAPGLDGQPRLFAFAQLPETDEKPVYVWVSSFKKVITANSDQLYLKTMAINLTIAIVLFLVFWLTWEGQVMRPLLALTQAARDLRAGDYQARSGLAPSDNEFGTLARMFDEMAESLSSKAEILQLNRALRVLSSCAENVVRARDEQELLDSVCRTVVELGEYAYAWIGFAEDDERGSIHVVASYGGVLDDVILNARPTWKEGEDRMGSVAEAISTGRRQVSQDHAAADVSTLSPWRKVVMKRGMNASVSFPLKFEGQVKGVLSILAGKTHVFTEAELALLEKLADDLTYGVNTRRVELERQRAEALAERLAKVDTVTELPNRIELIDHLQKHIKRTPGTDEPVAVLLVSIDRLTDVQDAIGIAGVDDVLRQFATRLSAQMAGIHYVARNSADSIAIVSPLAIEKPDSVARVVTGLVEEPIEYAGIPIGLQVTVGAALYPEHGDDADTLLRHADIAVRDARTAGNHFGIYRGVSESENPQNLILLAALRRGIRDDELVLYYQPKVSTSSTAVIGAEALVRWQQPERGMVPPGQFIPLAERTGLIKSLTYWVLGAAMRQTNLWQQRGGGTRIAVNVSQYNLRDPEFYEQFVNLPAKFGAKLENLDIEITESALMVDPHHTRALLERLCGLGVRVFIDDFGTGYSSLAYLATLPIHALKIDRSFVIKMHEPRFHTIVHSTISMAHSLDMKVVAEGVETLDLVEELAALGCDEIQGYVYSKPLPAEELEHWREQFSRGAEPAVGR